MKLGWYSNILLEAEEDEKKETEEDETPEGEDYQVDERPETEEELTANDEPDPTEGVTGEEDGAEEDTEGADYQLDERPENEEDLGGEPDPTEQVTGEEDGTEEGGEGDDYQLDGGGTEEGGEDTGEMTADGEGNIDGENPDSGAEGDDFGEEDNDKKEKYKKMILLDDYKELYNISINLQKSCENLNDRTNIKNKRLYNYLDTKVEQLVEKISFTIRVLFLSEDYRKLLTLFYHYKIQTNDIVKLFEFLIQSEEE